MSGEQTPSPGAGPSGDLAAAGNPRPALRGSEDLASESPAFAGPFRAWPRSCLLSRSDLFLWCRCCLLRQLLVSSSLCCCGLVASLFFYFSGISRGVLVTSREFSWARRRAEQPPVHRGPLRVHRLPGRLLGPEAARVSVWSVRLSFYRTAKRRFFLSFKMLSKATFRDDQRK